MTWNSATKGGVRCRRGHGERPADGTLVIGWQGDAALAWDGERLVSDAVFNGREWRITAAERAGVGERAGAGELRIQILPLADDAPVLVCAGRRRRW